MRSAQLTAQGIAEKLEQGLSQNTGELNAERWARIIKEATRNAFMEVKDGGRLIKLGQIPGFEEAVAQCTSLTVAPVGSDWALAVQETEVQGYRESLKQLGLAPSEIDRLMGELREANRRKRNQR